ncbi:MAG: SIR2 family protein [Thermosipho sp. (in: Bacteria)]|nr:SIR2 family protein [Thermosipho sp. (in: thermotogales)]
MIDSVLCPLIEKRYLKELVYYLNLYRAKNGKIAFWLGAGISKLLGYPLWEDLINQLIERFNIEKSQNFEFLKTLEIISEYKEKKKFSAVLEILKNIDENLYEKEIQKNFASAERNSEKNIGIFPIVREFIKNGIIVITTNIDMELQRFLNINDQYISIIPINEIRQLHKIIYLHGRIDYPNSWVMTETEYASVYDNEPRHCGRFLENFLSQCKVLVIMGYSLSEQEIYRKFLRFKNKPEIFWLQLLENNQKEFENQIIYFNDNLNLNIKPIPYKESKSLVSLLEYIYNSAYDLNIKEV